MKKYKSWVGILSWSLYDFANTIFSMNVISLYFALWVTVDKKAEDIFYSLAFSISMLVVALLGPLVGAMSDRYRRRIPFLVFFTLLCVVFTAFIGMTDRLLFGLIFFGLANIGYQTGGLIYTTLLTKLATQDTFGRVSGYGVSLGYIGTIVGLLMVRPFVINWGHQAAFLPTAILFLLFALPCFIFVKEEPIGQFGIWNLDFRNALEKVKYTIAHPQTFPGLTKFLIATFLFLNAINTIILFMSVYIKKVIGLSDAQMIMLFVVSTLFAIVGSFISGFICDIYGSKKTLSWILALWSCVLVLAAFLQKGLAVWVMGPLAGICLGSTWVSARALAVSLFPQEHLGEVFGFFGLSAMAASITGPLIWGIIIWLFRPLGLVRYRIAILFLLIFILAGLFFLRKVPQDKVQRRVT